MIVQNYGLCTIFYVYSYSWPLNINFTFLTTLPAMRHGNDYREGGSAGCLKEWETSQRKATMSSSLMDTCWTNMVRARIFSHFMCMEQTSGLTKTCASLWSPLVSFSFSLGYSSSLFLTLNSQLGCLSNKFFKQDYYYHFLKS